MKMFEGLKFEHPYFLFALFGIIPLVVWYIIRQRNTSATLQVSTIQNLSYNPVTFKRVLRHFLFFVQVLVLAGLIVVVARPQKWNVWKSTKTEGVDIVLALDVSSSMLAMDFKPDRLEVSKEVAIEFISGRRDDRIGLVVFSGESFTQCPLTIDHGVLINLLRTVESGMIKDGTAIGQGLANAVNRLKESKAESKVIILLTDGVNNSGSIAPLTAAEIARNFGIRVYTVGVGSHGEAPYPVRTRFGTQVQYQKVKIDEEVLQKISSLTNGKYFRATDKQKLIEIYDEINKMEKTIIDEKKITSKNEVYFWLAAGILALLVLEFVLRNLYVQTVP